VDRPDVVTFAGGATVDRDYDPDGNLTKLTDATGITTFAYNKMNRQTRKTLPDNSQLRYDYDHNGNLTQFTDAGGQVGYTYNQVYLWRASHFPDIGPYKVRPGMEDGECRNGEGSLVPSSRLRP